MILLFIPANLCRFCRIVLCFIFWNDNNCSHLVKRGLFGVQDKKSYKSKIIIKKLDCRKAKKGKNLVSDSTVHFLQFFFISAQYFRVFTFDCILHNWSFFCKMSFDGECFQKSYQLQSSTRQQTQLRLQPAYAFNQTTFVFDLPILVNKPNRMHVSLKLLKLSNRQEIVHQHNVLPCKADKNPKRKTPVSSPCGAHAMLYTKFFFSLLQQLVQ